MLTKEILDSHPLKKAKAPKAKAPAKPKGTHKMPDGSEMTGKVHSKDSKPVKKKEAPAKPKSPAKPKAKPKKAKDEPKTKGVNKKVKFFELAKGQGTSTKIGNVVGPDGNTYSPFIASRFWNARGFERAQFSKTDLKKIEKLAIKYGPIGEYSLGFNLDGFLKNKF